MVDRLKSWQKLEQSAALLGDTTLRDFLEEQDRFEKFTMRHDGVFLDLSRNSVDSATMQMLYELARETEVEARLRDLMSGKKINVSENRAVLHTALRDFSRQELVVDGVDVKLAIDLELARLKAASQAIRTKKWLGSTGKSIEKVVSIGIGGSYLGPKMVVAALDKFVDAPVDLVFVSNVDPSDFYRAIKGANPETTLFLVASKTFTTDETISNAQLARQWLESELNVGFMHSQFIALTANADAAIKFGVHANNVFKFWDWVGGRYSLLSAIGLPEMIAVGFDNFEQMRRGAYSIDRHVLQSCPEDNIPLNLALIDIWNQNFLGHESRAIIPYSQDLRHLVGYLQQATMESNGKSTSLDGQKLDIDTAMLVWGGTGTNSQHSFFQFLHQGTNVVPVDFIGFRRFSGGLMPAGHKKLLANMLAQAEALALGVNEQELAQNGVDENLIAYKVLPGNRPSNILVLEEITPYTLGQIVAIYEHRIFYKGAVWGIDSFDQMGVEYGKLLSRTAYEYMEGSRERSGLHLSTVALLDEIIDPEE